MHGLRNKGWTVTPRWLVFLGCLYEAYAISTEKAPTISHMTWKYRAHRWGRVVVLGVWAWLTFHLFVETEKPLTLTL